jgi:DNA-3-methyladenine glycosylase
MTEKLQRTFYAQSARTVAQALLGTRIVHCVDGQRISGSVIETEAYCDGDQPDLACHGARNQGNPTTRTAVMFGEAGHIYIYLNYGLHWLFNVSTGAIDQPNAVLIRAVAPDEGEPFMQARRFPQSRFNWTNGPGKWTKAFALDGTFNGVDLCDPKSVVWIEPTGNRPPISSGPRVGLGKTPEPWYSIAWRYWVTDNPFVSNYRP